MTGPTLRAGAFACAGLVLASGAAFPLLAARSVGAVAPLAAVGDGALHALAPALALVVVARLGRSGRLASWAAFVGAALTVALGLALYAAALSARRPDALYVATDLVPLRQLAASAVAAWATWVVRGRG